MGWKFKWAKDSKGFKVDAKVECKQMQAKHQGYRVMVKIFTLQRISAAPQVITCNRLELEIKSLITGNDNFYSSSLPLCLFTPSYAEPLVFSHTSSGQRLRGAPV